MKKTVTSSLNCITSTIGHYRNGLTHAFAAKPNDGKSLYLCSEASHFVKNKLNCLYVTVEMGKEHIWKRIVCNVLGVSKQNITSLDPTYIQKQLNDLGTLNILETNNLSDVIGNIYDNLDVIIIDGIELILKSDYQSVCLLEKILQDKQIPLITSIQIPMDGYDTIKSPIIDYLDLVVSVEKKDNVFTNKILKNRITESEFFTEFDTNTFEISNK